MAFFDRAYRTEEGLVRNSFYEVKKRRSQRELDEYRISIGSPKTVEIDIKSNKKRKVN